MCYPPLCLPHSPPLWVRPSGFICANVGPQGLLVLGLPAPFVPHSASLSPRHSHASPLHPGARLRPSYQSGWMFIFHFLGVGPPCCSILGQFWLCEEAQRVHLCRHLGSPCLLFFYPVIVFASGNSLSQRGMCLLGPSSVAGLCYGQFEVGEERGIVISSCIGFKTRGKQGLPPSQNFTQS